jgi:hypothetical protein
MLIEDLPGRAQAVDKPNGVPTLEPVRSSHIDCFAGDRCQVGSSRLLRRSLKRAAATSPTRRADSGVIDHGKAATFIMV